MPTDTFCSDTLYVHTAPDDLPSFAEEMQFLGRKKHSKLMRACTLGLQLRRHESQECVHVNACSHLHVVRPTG